jgi:hypothetical protein
VQELVDLSALGLVESPMQLLVLELVDLLVPGLVESLVQLLVLELVELQAAQLEVLVAQWARVWGHPLD